MTDLGDERIDFDATVEGALEAAHRGDLGRWVQEFLRSPGSDNAPLGAELRSELSSWYGPVRLPFDELHRLAGPADQPTLVRLEDDDLERVDDMQESLDDGWQPPPVIVSYEDGKLYVEDGNHRIEGLRRAGCSNYWSVVGFSDEQQRQRFLDKSFGFGAEPVEGTAQQA
jgi:ParB-like nuclease domain